MRAVFKDSWGVETDDISHVHDLSAILELWNHADFLAEAQRRFDLGKVIQDCGTWAVTDFGMECLVTYYPIPKDRLYNNEPHYGWVRHMIQTKRWCNIRDFAECLTQARLYHDPQTETSPSRRKKKVVKIGEAKPRSPISPKLRFEILKRDRYSCRLCGDTAYMGAVLHIDHIVPVAAGGTNARDNLWITCEKCNLGKGVDEL